MGHAMPLITSWLCTVNAGHPAILFLKPCPSAMHFTWPLMEVSLQE